MSSHRSLVARARVPTAATRKFTGLVRTISHQTAVAPGGSPRGVTRWAPIVGMPLAVTPASMSTNSAPEPGAARQLALGTISFAVCFTAWGLVSAFAPTFRSLYHLTATEVALLVAVPVLLGSIARVPLGILTDRRGGRLV